MLLPRNSVTRMPHIWRLLYLASPSTLALTIHPDSCRQEDGVSSSVGPCHRCFWSPGALPLSRLFLPSIYDTGIHEVRLILLNAIHPPSYAAPFDVALPLSVAAVVLVCTGAGITPAVSIIAR